VEPRGHQRATHRCTRADGTLDQPRFSLGVEGGAAFEPPVESMAIAAAKVVMDHRNSLKMKRFLVFLCKKELLSHLNIVR
jgi:hypothetical protein